MMRALLCAVGLALAMTATASANSSSAISSYAGALRSAAGALDDTAARQHQGSAVPEISVPPAPLPGPPRFSPSLGGWLHDQLTAAREEKNVKRRAQMLRDAATSLREAARVAQAPAAQGPGRELGPTLAAILAQPAYHETESTVQAQVQKTWWQRFLEWLAGLFDKLFGGLFAAAAGVPWVGKLIVYVTLSALAVLIVYVATRLARYLLRARPVAIDDDEGELLAHRASASELLDMARAAARAGDHARAISLLFRAALRRLDASGVIPYDAARTAGEYRRAVRKSCAVASAPFDALAHTFTLAAYAQAPVAESNWYTADAAYKSFEPGVAERVAGPAT
jgi:hypothetical protein